MNSEWQKVSLEEAKQHELYGVGGWLIVFALGVPIRLLFSLGVIGGGAYLTGTSISDLLAIDTPAAAWFKVELALHSLAVVIIYWLLFSKHPNFRTIAILIIIGVWPIEAAINIANPYPGIWVDVARRFSYWIISCIVWVTYLQRSERIRVTFEHKIRNIKEKIRPNAAKNEKRILSSVIDTVTGMEEQAHVVDHKSYDKRLYEIAWLELKANRMDKGLWAKAYAENDGNDRKAGAKYISERVRQLDAEFQEKLKSIDAYHKDGQTSLIKAVRAIDVTAVEELIEQGANPNIKDDTFRTSTALGLAKILLKQAKTPVAKENYQQIISILDSAGKIVSTEASDEFQSPSDGKLRRAVKKPRSVAQSARLPSKGSTATVWILSIVGIIILFVLFAAGQGDRGSSSVQGSYSPSSMTTNITPSKATTGVNVTSRRSASSQNSSNLIGKNTSKPSTSRLKSGSERDELIVRIQSRLKALGFDPGEVNGIYGKNTKTAIQEFERDINIGRYPKGGITDELEQMIHRAESTIPAEIIGRSTAAYTPSVVMTPTKKSESSRISLPRASSKASKPRASSEKNRRRALIVEVQSLLKYLGYKIGTVDGVDGESTRAAIKKFERDIGEYPHGKVTADLKQMLKIRTTILESPTNTTIYSSEWHMNKNH